MHNYVVQFKLWSKVKRPENPNRFYDDCWEWLGRRRADKNGNLWHGYFSHRGQTYSAHRVAYELATGQAAPEDLVIRHKCNFAACVNPRHLETGTNADNVKDRVAARRSATGFRNGHYTKPERMPKGETHGNSKLRNRDIQVIRNTAKKYSETYGIGAYLARKFGISRVNVGRIVSKQLWVQVSDDFSVPCLAPGPGELNLRRGTRNPLSKFTDRQIQEMRFLYKQAAGVRGAISEIARRYGTDASSVGEIVRKVIWSRVPDDFASMDALEPLPTNPLRPRPDNHGGSKLTPEVVQEIRELNAQGISQKELCGRYGLTAGPMSSLINRKTWRGI